MSERMHRQRQRIHNATHEEARLSLSNAATKEQSFLVPGKSSAHSMLSGSMQTNATDMRSGYDFSKVPVRINEATNNLLPSEDTLPYTLSRPAGFASRPMVSDMGDSPKRIAYQSRFTDCYASKKRD